MKICCGRFVLWRGGEFHPTLILVSRPFSSLDRHWPGAAGREGHYRDFIRSPWRRDGVVDARAGVLSREAKEILVAPPYVPYAPGFSMNGVDLTKLLLVNSGMKRRVCGCWSRFSMLAVPPLCHAATIERNSITASAIGRRKRGGCGFCCAGRTGSRTPPPLRRVPCGLQRRAIGSISSNAVALAGGGIEAGCPVVLVPKPGPWKQNKYALAGHSLSLSGAGVARCRCVRAAAGHRRNAGFAAADSDVQQERGGAGHCRRHAARAAQRTLFQAVCSAA